MMTKRCAACKIDKPANSDNFSKANASKDGLQARCKPCQSAYYKEWLKRNGRDRRVKTNLKEQ